MAKPTPLQVWQNTFRFDFHAAARELTTEEERYALWAFIVLRATYELAPEGTAKAPQGPE